MCIYIHMHRQRGRSYCITYYILHIGYWLLMRMTWGEPMPWATHGTHELATKAQRVRPGYKTAFPLPCVPGVGGLEIICIEIHSYIHIYIVAGYIYIYVYIYVYLLNIYRLNIYLWWMVNIYIYGENIHANCFAVHTGPTSHPLDAVHGTQPPEPVFRAHGLPNW